MAGICHTGYMEHTELVKTGRVMSGFDMEDTYVVVCSCGHRSTKARVFADAIIDKARHKGEHNDR